jgi:aspartate/methionine/tyrosine aminotransferase
MAPSIWRRGFPISPRPPKIKRAAQEAIAADVNQYAITWGAKSLRNASPAR